MSIVEPLVVYVVTKNMVYLTVMVEYTQNQFLKARPTLPTGN
jgi:hypothetical protein